MTLTYLVVVVIVIENISVHICEIVLSLLLVLTKVLDNAQTAVFTSAKSVQYVQILLIGPLGCKQTSGIP